MSTKLDALRQHIHEGRQHTQQETVLLALTQRAGWQTDALTRLQVEFVTEIRTSSVCARLNELIALGKVEVRGTTECQYTRKKVHLYAAVRPALATKIHQPPGAQHG